ncbi:MAG TPA: tetratricopeptide repeat protein [Pyrinomonadaceae bacterium]
MKTPTRLALVAPLAAAGLLFVCAPTTRAQAQPPATQSTPQTKDKDPAPTEDQRKDKDPAADKTQSAPTTGTPAQTAAQPANLSPRERRARAYAKLLEGQRYLSMGRAVGGITREAITRAQAALNEALALEPTLSEAHTAQAELAFFFLDDLDLAEREAQAAARINRDNFGAHRVLARVYALKAGLDEDKFDRTLAARAITELREVLRLDPNDPEALALLGEFYQLTGKPDDALDAFRRWAAAPPAVDVRFYQVITEGRDLSPDAASARLGEVLLKAGRTAEALATIRRVLAASPDNPAYLQLLGRALEAGGVDSGALDDLRRMIAANPANAAAVSLLAQTQARAGQTDEAAATLRAGINERKTEARARNALTNQLAEVLAEALRYEEAIQTYEDALKARDITDKPLVADSDKQTASRLLSRVVELQKQAGRNEAAAATIARMRVLLGPDDPQADYQQALLLRDEGKREEALAVIRAARLKFQADGVQQAFLQLEARTLAELGRPDEAAGLLRARLTGKVEEDFNTYLTIANLYLDAGRGKEAVAAAQELLKLVPADQPELTMQALLMLSSAQERAGDFKNAEASLRRILAKDPANATALNNLGYFLAERNERLEEALDMTKRAVKAEPTNASFLDSLGWVYYKLGQLDEAERYLSDAARRNARSVAINEHLGDLHQRRGKTTEAQAAWRKALSLATETGDITRIKGKLGTKP